MLELNRQLFLLVHSLGMTNKIWKPLCQCPDAWNPVSSPLSSELGQYASQGQIRALT